MYGKENEQAGTGLKTQETINKKRKREPVLFTLKQINIWNKLLEQTARVKGINEFNRYLLCLLEEGKKNKEKLDQRNKECFSFP